VEDFNPTQENPAAADDLLLAVGYSARETADIVSERISVEALDNARHIRAAGLGREHAANYVDREYRRAAMRRERLRQPSDELAAVLRGSIRSSRSTRARTALTPPSCAQSSRPNRAIRRWPYRGPARSV
jgi:hypothetical protein